MNGFISNSGEKMNKIEMLEATTTFLILIGLLYTMMFL
jgi:hypothetical protein